MSCSKHRQVCRTFPRLPADGAFDFPYLDPLTPPPLSSCCSPRGLTGCQSLDRTVTTFPHARPSRDTDGSCALQGRTTGQYLVA